MPKNSFLKAVFGGPKFSLSPIEKTNKGTIRIGEVVPVYKTMLMGRETLSLNLGHLVRFAPTVVPTMEGYEVNFDAFCVPVSALGYPQRMERDIMDFHNLALNDGTEVNPFCKTLSNLHTYNSIKNGAAAGDVGDLFRIGSLGDYLNLSSFKRFRDFARRWLYSLGFVEGGLYNRFEDDEDNPVTDGYDVFDFAARVFINSKYIEETDLINVIFDASGKNYGIRTYELNIPFPSTIEALAYLVGYKYGDGYSGDYGLFGDYNALGSDMAGVVFRGAPSFPAYLMQNYPLLAEYYGYTNTGDSSEPNIFINHLFTMREAGNLDLNYLDKLYEFYKVDAESAFDEYFNYIMSQLLYNFDLYNYGISAEDRLWEGSYRCLPDLTELDLDLSYFSAYWKIISDWYINTNIDGDPNEFFINHAGAVLVNDARNHGYLDVKPFHRRWANDVFTSAVPSASVTNVQIPVNGTIPDLRDANAFQKLVDILRNTGKRLRDVQYGIRGYKPTANLTDMSQPLGSLHSFVGMQSVLQTSQTTKDSPQAAYSGVGTDSSRGDYRSILKVINSDESTPVIVMVLMSVTQRATYMQCLPRYFAKRASIYDFAIPQLANIGEQEIKLSELYCDMLDDDEAYSNDMIFGFNRRYYDWFYEDNEVHGEMRDTQDFWHGARIFDSVPALNSEFIEINSDKDDLNRIFANVSPDAMPIYYNVYFEGAKVVALPRYIQYDL